MSSQRIWRGLCLGWLLVEIGISCPQAALANKADAGLGLQLRGMGDACRMALQQGDLDRAENIARERLSLATSANREHWIGNSLTLLAKVLRFRGKYQESEALLTKALPLVESEDGIDSIQAIRTLDNLAQVEMIQGRYAQAKALNDKALERTQRARPTSLERLQALNIGAAIESLLHRDEAALALLDRALAVPIDAGDATEHEIDYARVRSLHTRGASEFRLGRLALAKEHLREASEGYARLDTESYDSIAAAEGLGFVEEAQGEEAEAAHIFQANLATAQRVLGPTHPLTARIEGILANSLAGLGQRDAAAPLHQHALDILRAANAPEFLAYEARLDAQYLTAGGDLKGALVAQRLALDAIDAEYAQTRGLDEGDRADFIDRYAGYYAQTLGTLLALHQASPEQGYDREALEVVSRTQSRFFTELMREADVSRFSSNPDYQALRARQTDAQEKLAESRRERAAIADERPGESELRGEDEADDEEAPESAAHERRVKVPHSTRQNSEGKGVESRRREDPIVAARREASARALDQKILQQVKILEGVDDQLWSRFPRYMELSQPRPVSVAQLQGEVVKPGEVLLTYYLLPNETLAFVLTRSTLHLVRLPLARAAVGQLVARLRAPEDNADEGIASLAQLQPAQLYDAYQKLISPVEPFFEGAHRILVVADGPLLTLPFEMLVTRWTPPDQRRFDEARRAATLPLAEYATPTYLGERYEFAYLPSLSTFVSMRLYAKPSVQYQTEFVSFADPLFEGASDGLQTGSEGLLLQRNLRMRDGKLSIPRLPETAEEARGIAEILGGQSHLYLRADAQEHTLKTIDLRSVRFLHFATHGLLGGEFSAVDTDSGAAQEQSTQAKPLPTARAEPALLLSLAGDMQGEDGLLTAHEVVQSLNLNAQLVILSACNTAGEHDAAHSGEGVAGLTRAFAFAGARGLVVSHWTVESEATEDTMLALFRDLKAGMGPTESLSKARAAIRSSSVQVSGVPWSRSHPFFWAPFIYVGD